MKKILTLIIMLKCLNVAHSQITVSDFYSIKLDSIREIQIGLPLNYDSTKKYPCIYVLDAEYLGGYIHGLISNLAYWKKSPECITIGIFQEKWRWKDCNYDNKGELTKSGLKFYEFITEELIPFVDSNYSTSKFRVIAGHSFTANYINYFMFNSPDLFRGYLSMSPYFSGGTKEKLQQMPLQDVKPYYFLSVGSKDLSGHISSINEHLKKFQINNSLNFKFREYKDKTHISLINACLSDGLEYLFSGYKTFDSDNYREIKKEKVSAFDYFLNYYKHLKTMYDIDLPYRDVDAEIISNILERNKDWQELEKMGVFCIKHFPDCYLGYYNRAYVAESNKNYKEALELFEIGYSKLSKNTLNKEDFYADIERMRKKIK